MLNVRNPKNARTLKSTMRPLYANTQATDKSVLLDPAWDRSVDIYPGMAMMRTGGRKVTLLNATGVPAGFASIFVAPGRGLDQVADSGVNAFPMWVLGPDAKFEILAPAFDETLSWVDPADGTSLLITAYTGGAKRGKLCPIGTAVANGNTVGTVPIARLAEVVSSTKINIEGLQARTA